METYTEWLEKEQVTHAHCPYECEHPQPFIDAGELICGYCFFFYDLRTVMIPCTPQVCG